MDDLSIAPTCERWLELLEKLRTENAPLTLKELKVNGADLLALGITPAHISKVLHALLLHAVVNPKDNEKQRLLTLAISFAKNV